MPFVLPWGSWSVCAAIILSLAGTAAGILSFRNAHETGGHGARLRTVLYWTSLLPSVCWYVIPFLEQPRFPSLREGIATGNLLHLATGAIGLATCLVYGCLAMKVVHENGKATGDVMVDFLQPSTLLSAGHYGRVRHPMFLFDFMTHAGLAVCCGALAGALLLPIYFAMSALICHAEEKWVLEPRFGERFIRYRTAVPGYMTTREAGMSLFLAGMACLSALGHDGAIA